MIMELIGKRSWLQWIAAAFIVSLLGVRGHAARADAPAGRYTTAGNEVTDSKTGLVWKKTEEPGIFNWPAAKAQCTSLGGSWRLPNIRELESLVDETRTETPTIDTKAFADAPSGGTLWSSTALALNPTPGETWRGTWVWVIFFGSGHTNYAEDNHVCHVRCVR